MKLRLRPSLILFMALLSFFLAPSSSFAEDPSGKRVRCQNVHALLPPILMTLTSAAPGESDQPTRLDEERVRAVINRMSLDLRSEFELPWSVEVILKKGGGTTYYGSDQLKMQLHLAEAPNYPGYSQVSHAPAMVAHEYGHLIHFKNLAPLIPELLEKMETLRSVMSYLARMLQHSEMNQDSEGFSLAKNEYMKTSREYLKYDYLYQAHSELMADVFAISYSDRSDAISRGFPPDKVEHRLRNFDADEAAVSAELKRMTTSSSGPYFLFLPTRTYIWKNLLLPTQGDREARTRVVRAIFEASAIELRNVSAFMQQGGPMLPPEVLNRELIQEIDVRVKASLNR